MRFSIYLEISWTEASVKLNAIGALVDIIYTEQQRLDDTRDWDYGEDDEYGRVTQLFGNIRSEVG